MVTRAAVPWQRWKTPPSAIWKRSAFTALRPVAAIILPWQLRPSNLIAEILELHRGSFEGMTGKRGCPSQYSCQSTRPSPPFMPFWCMHAHTRTHTEWEGEYVESLAVIFVKCGLCALLSNSPKTCYSSFCFLSFPLSLFVSKFLFISSSLILPGESEMLLLSFFSTSRAFTAD